MKRRMNGAGLEQGAESSQQSDGSTQRQRDGDRGERTQEQGAATASPAAKTGARFYDRVLTREEIELVAGMAANPSLNDEIALLKVLIRRKLEEGSDLATISKAVDALARALKVQKQISDEGHRALQDALVAVLAELGEQGAGSRQQRVASKKRAKDVVIR